MRIESITPVREGDRVALAMQVTNGVGQRFTINKLVPNDSDLGQPIKWEAGVYVLTTDEESIVQAAGRVYIAENQAALAALLVASG